MIGTDSLNLAHVNVWKSITAMFEHVDAFHTYCARVPVAVCHLCLVPAVCSTRVLLQCVSTSSV